MVTKRTVVKSTKKRSVARTSGFGQAMLKSLRGWEAGEPVTVRDVESIPDPTQRDGRQIKRLRAETLGVSQAVFAQLLGVSSKLVEAWEAGRNIPAGPVCRLFEVIERNPKSFLRKYVKGAA